MWGPGGHHSAAAALVPRLLQQWQGNELIMLGYMVWLDTVTPD